MIKVNCAKVFEKPKWMLSKTGLWPALVMTNSERMKLFLNLILDLILLEIIFHNIFNAIRNDNIKLLNRMTCILISMVNYSAKSSTLLVNKKCFISILKDIDSKIFNSHSNKLNGHIQFIYTISQHLYQYFVLALTAYMLIGSILPIVINIGLTIPAPVNLDKFEILYRIVHFFATGYLAFNTAGFDVLYLTLMSLCSAQLSILQDQLQYILEDDEKINSKLENVDVRIKVALKECIILHETINKFVKKMIVLLSFPLFVQYTCGCFILCNTVLQLTILRESGSTNIISMCGYAGITFAQMAAYHWLGNEITFKSDKIIEASYSSTWYQMDTKTQKVLILLMERAKRPLVVQLYKLVFISLDSLGVIIRWAYSVFALIKARYS